MKGIMMDSRTWLLMCVLLIPGCATLNPSMPPPPNVAALASVSVPADLPAAEYIPEQAVIATGTRYVVIQAQGGSVFLGPLLGSANITAKTKAMAENFKDTILSVDPAPAVITALDQSQFRVADKVDGLRVKPFVFIHHCYDDRLRLSLVFHVDSPVSKWVGRYTYHLPTSYPTATFNTLPREGLDEYRRELADGAEILARLLARDMKGDLPATGKRVKLGSLYLIGNKLGGLGMYTMPEEAAFSDAQLIDETETLITFRLKGHMGTVGAFGGLIFGVHSMDKKLAHTFQHL